jgi:hypothetical protein
VGLRSGRELSGLSAFMSCIGPVMEMQWRGHGGTMIVWLGQRADAAAPRRGPCCASLKASV